MSADGAPHGRRIAGTALLVVLSFVPLALIEAGARVLGLDAVVVGAVSKELYPPGLFSGTRLWDPTLQWILQPTAMLPNDVGRVNSLGFVGRETTQAKPPGRIRVLTMGDSVTYGLWACGKSTMCRTRPYPTALELKLWTAQPGDRYEVVNAGVYGYSTQQGLRDFRTRLHALGADIVLVMYGWNDHGAKTGVEPRDPAAPAVRTLLDRAQRLATYRIGMGLLTFATAQVRGAAWGIPDAYEPRVAPAAFGENLVALAAAIRATGARVAFVTEPAGPLSQPYVERTVPTPWELYRLPSYEALVRTHDEYMAEVRAAGARADVPVIDAVAAFAPHDAATLFDPYDMVHPNEAGSALLADVAYAQLDALGWLRP